MVRLTINLSHSIARRLIDLSCSGKCRCVQHEWLFLSLLGGKEFFAQASFFVLRAPATTSYPHCNCRVLSKSCPRNPRYLATCFQLGEAFFRFSKAIVSFTTQFFVLHFQDKMHQFDQLANGRVWSVLGRLTLLIFKIQF